MDTLHPQPKRILVVDDEQDLREAIKTVLSYEGYIVDTAVDGNDALEKAQAHHPDLILLDIIMPNRDGIDTLRALREESWGATVPVIIMTVLDDMVRISEAIEAGANEYMVKTDISLGTIVHKVRERLGSE